MSEAPFVTVNILAHNRKDALATSLRAIENDLAYPRERLEVIVVDNGSTDGTREMLGREFPDVRVIESENVGAAGWTRGFEAGRGEYFLVLDDDCYIEGESLTNAVQAAQTHGADLVSFRVVSSYDPSFEFNAQYNVGLLSFWGCAALVSGRAVRELGGYDPNIFIWGNELEFTIRFLDKGFRHLFLAEVTAVHMKRPATGLSVDAYEVHMRHLAYLIVKLLRPFDAAVVLTNLVTKLLLGLPLAPGRWRVILALLSGMRLGLRSRAPVRPEVSRFYRANFREFTSPLFYLHPLGLWRGHHHRQGTGGYRASRHEDYYASRPKLYPTETASLTVP